MRGARGQLHKSEPPALPPRPRVDAPMGCQGETNYDLQRNLAIESWDSPVAFDELVLNTAVLLT